MNDRRLIDLFLAERGEAAFRALYREHTPYLYGLALRLAGGRREEAEEAVQEAWVRAIERLEGFRGASRLRTWLAGIVVNCCRELRRERSDATAGEAPDSEPALDGGPPAQIDLERLLSALPDGQREVLVLHQIEGYTHQEIAARLGIAPGTSKSRLFEARRRLRQEWSPEDSGGSV